MREPLNFAEDASEAHAVAEGWDDERVWNQNVGAPSIATPSSLPTPLSAV